MDGDGQSHHGQDMELLREQQFTLQQHIQQQQQQLEQANTTINALQSQFQLFSVGNAGSHERTAYGPRTSLKLAPLDKITGRNAAQLRDWFPIARTHIIANQIDPNSVEALLYTASHFKMPLARWWARRVSETNDTTAGFRSFDSLANGAMNMYCTRDPEEVAREKIDRLVQTKSVIDYVHHFEDLQAQIHDRSQRDRLFEFIKGLKPAIKERVQIQNPTTFDEAVRLAETYDNLLFHRSAEKRNGRKMGYNRPSTYFRDGASNHGSCYQSNYALNNPQPMELGHLHYMDDTAPIRADQGDGSDPDLYHIRSSTYTHASSKRNNRKLRGSDREQLHKLNGCVYCRQVSHTVHHCPVLQALRQHRQLPSAHHPVKRDTHYGNYRSKN